MAGDVQKAGTIYWDLIARGGLFGAGMKQASAAVKQFAGIVKSAQFIAVASFVAIGVASIKAARKAVGAFAIFDAAIREVATLLPVTREGLVGIEEALINLSTRVPAPPELLAQATYQAVSAGLTDAADALLVVEKAAVAATAGLSDAFTAVDAITTVLNAYQLSASEAGRVSDVFFKTIEQGKLRFADIASNIGNVATSAALGNVKLEELGAALATLTKFGINAAEASTSLNRAILSIINPTKAQTDAAEKYGVELSATALKTKGFTQVLRELEDATGGSVEALGQIFPNIRAARSLFILAGNGADEYRRILREVTNSTGATQAAFQDIAGSLQTQRALLKNNVNALWLQLGQNILPLVVPIVEKLNRLFESQDATLLRLAKSAGDYATVLEQEAIVKLQEMEKILNQIELSLQFSAVGESALNALIGPAGLALGDLLGTLDKDVSAVFQELLKFSFVITDNLEDQVKASKLLVARTKDVIKEKRKSGDITKEEIQILEDYIISLERQAAKVSSYAQAEENITREKEKQAGIQKEINELQARLNQQREFRGADDPVIQQLEAELASRQALGEFLEASAAFTKAAQQADVKGIELTTAAVTKYREEWDKAHLAAGDASEERREQLRQERDALLELENRTKAMEDSRRAFQNAEEAIARMGRAAADAAPSVFDLIFQATGIERFDIEKHVEDLSGNYSLLLQRLRDFNIDTITSQLEGTRAVQVTNAWAAALLVLDAAMRQTQAGGLAPAPIVGPGPEATEVDDAIRAVAAAGDEFGITALRINDILATFTGDLETLSPHTKELVFDFLNLAIAADEVSTATSTAAEKVGGMETAIIGLLREGKGLESAELLAKSFDEVAEALEWVKENITDIEDELTRERLIEYLKRVAEGYDKISTALKSPELSDLNRPALTGEADLEALDTQKLNTFRREIERISREMQHVGLRALAVNGALLQWGYSLDDLPPKLREIAESMLMTEETTEETGTSLEDVLDTTVLAANAAINLARAFGLASGEAAELARNITGIAEGIGRIAAGDVLGGAIQAGTSLIALGAGVFGQSAGEKQAEENRIKVLEQNARVVERLTTELGALGDAIRTLSGRLLDVFGDAADEFGSVLDDIEQNPTEGFGGGFRDTARLNLASDAFIDSLKASGITAIELALVLDALGVSGEHIIRQFEHGDAAMTELNNEMVAFTDALRQASFEELFEGFGGQQREDEIRRQLTDTDTEENQLRDLIKNILEFGDLPDDFKKVLEGIDWENLTGADLDAIDAALKLFFDQLTSDPDAFEFLGELTPDQILAWIRSVDGLTDSLQDTADATGPDSTSFQVFRGITEITGNRIAGLLETDTYWNRLTALNTEALVNILGGDKVTVPSPTPFPGDPMNSLFPPTLEALKEFFGNAGQPTVQIDSFEIAFNLLSGTLDDDQAQRAGEIAAAEFDRALGDFYTVHRRSIGDRPVRTS